MATRYVINDDMTGITKPVGGFKKVKIVLMLDFRRGRYGALLPVARSHELVDRL